MVWLYVPGLAASSSELKRTLWGQLADTGHAERTGGQAMRTKAKGKHAMSLHHVVEGWE